MFEFVGDFEGLVEVLCDVCVLVVLFEVCIDVELVYCVLWLCVIGCVSGGVENIDVEVCCKVGVDVVCF